MLTGLAPDISAATRPGPEYDPACRSPAERERVKAAELAALGEEITARTVKSQRQRYEGGGIATVVDGRPAPHASLMGRSDPRVVAAIRQAIDRPAGAPAITSDLAWDVAGDPDMVRAWALA